MAGLGTTVEPTGEPGIVTSEPPQEMETIPDNPSTITWTTSMMTLMSLLYQNYIRKATYTISTTMPAGTVFFAFKIKPEECNYANATVATLFNAWTGGMKIRTRIPATAWYGGSIRIGRLPPNMTEQEVFSAPLELLTAHPNMDLDPKNTSWVHFKVSDQRDVGYHYFDTPDSDFRSFGGWVVGFLASRLVTQSPEFTQVEMLVEIAGDFQYDQPSRRLPQSVSNLDPLAPSTQFPLHLHPILDAPTSGIGNIVQVCPVTVNQLAAGGLTMSAVGLPLALGQLPSLQITSGREAVVTQQRSEDPDSFGLMTGSISEQTITMVYQGRSWLNMEMHTGPEGAVYSTIPYTAIGHIPVASQSVFFNSIDTTSNVLTATMEVNPTDQENPNSPIGILNVSSPCMCNNVQPLDPQKMVNASTGGPIMQLRPLAGGESIVIFGNLFSRTMSVQTELMREALATQANQSSSNTSWVYNLTNASGTPLLVVRLNPNGMFTSNPVTQAVVFPSKGLKLVFLQQLPLSDPLPAPSFFMRNLHADLRHQVRRAKERDVAMNLMLKESADLIDTY